MQLFIDTANVEDIARAVASGFIDGVTTNPSIISRENKSLLDCVREIRNISPELTILLEVTSRTPDDMEEEARHLTKIGGPHAVVKLPATSSGLAAVRRLRRHQIRTTVTLVFSVNQAIAASCAGADFVAPFVGRLDDIDCDGVALVRSISEVFRAQDASTKIIAASVRSPQLVSDLFRAGTDIVTMPFGVIAQMLNHPLTSQGLAKFEEDWAKVPAGG
jgi:transaldolase